MNGLVARLFLVDNYLFINFMKRSEVAAKWNMQTGEVIRMNYTHQKVDKKRITITVYLDKKIFAESYHNHDLMTIMDLDGNLRFNVYGNNWNKRDESQLEHFRKVIFRNTTDRLKK